MFLYVVCDKSSYFVITEHSQGQSIADLLKERSRFDVEDALSIMTPLAGDTGNAMLYRALQGSPAFRSSGGFFHKLKSAPQPDSRESRALRGPVLSTQENSVSLHGTSAVIRGFDRDTRWLATGVLGALVFAAFVLAVLVPEHYPNAVDLAEAVQARGNLSLNANISTLSKEVDVTGKSSTGETTAGLGSRIDRGFSEVSQEENRTTQMEAATSTPTPVLASTPEINDMSVQVAASLRSPAYQQDHARSIRLKITRARSSRPIRHKFVDVIMRLIALWHQSLVRSERSPSWTQFSNLNKGERKKVGYTAQMSH